MFEFCLPFRIWRKRVARMRLPLRLNREHFACIIENGGGGVFFGAHPFRIAERAERRRFFSDTDISRHEIGLLERDVEFRFIGKLERENFLCPICSGTGRGCSFGSRFRKFE